MFTLFSVSIQYCMIGLYPAVTSYLWFYVVCILIAASATGYGYTISAIAPSVEAANAIAPPLMVPLLLFGGFFLQSDTVPAYFIWLKYMSWFYYGAENLYVTQWNDGGACLGIPDMGVVRILNSCAKCVIKMCPYFSENLTLYLINAPFPKNFLTPLCPTVTASVDSGSNLFFSLAVEFRAISRYQRTPVHLMI